MRNIEFRAKMKRAINKYKPAGSWVYGGYYFWKHGACIHEKDSVIGLYVDPDTVGQYTGHLDCFGVKIFEGDCVWVSDWGLGGIIYFDSAWKFRFFDNSGGKLLKTIHRICGVNGNIYDNPEKITNGNGDIETMYKLLGRNNFGRRGEICLT
jgi:hypothetical protein